MIYTDFSVKNYRGIRQCKLEKLELVNLFFGKNNCGKSSLLESLFILSGPDNPTLPILANKSRALDSLEETDLKIEFYQADPDDIIQLSSLGEQSRQVSIQMIESHSQNISLEDLQKNSSESIGRRYGLKINFSTEAEKESKYHSELMVTEEKSGNITSDQRYKEVLYAEYIPSNHIQSDIAEKLTEIIQNKQENEIVEALQIVEPRITDVQLVGKRIMVDVGLPTRLPINVLGDGVRKVLAVILSIYTCRNGVLIIDELDNGLHFSVMPQLWKVILYMCQKHHTQIFASTHSLDLVKSLVQTINQSDDPQPIASYKLIRKNDDELVALRYSAEELTYAIKQEMEVR